MCTVYHNAGFAQQGFVFWRLPLSNDGRSVEVLHQRMIHVFVVDLVAKRLVVERDTIVLIFHHSIISRASHGCFGGFMPPVEKGCSISQPLGLGV